MKSATRVIYIHGFGGREFFPENARRLGQEFRGFHRDLSVEAWEWESGSLSKDSVGREFNDANKKADVEGVKLANALRDGRFGERFHIVAFSLGCRVALQALRELRAGCRPESVILMAPAVPHNEKLSTIAVRPKRPILTYYSPKSDKVLRHLYRAMSGDPAAGELGFVEGTTTSELVRNLRVTRSHKLVGNYGGFIQPLAELLCWLDEQPVEGSAPKSVGSKTLGGKVLWDEVYREGSLIVQANTFWMTVGKPFYRLIDTSRGDLELIHGWRLAPLLQLAEQQRLASHGALPRCPTCGTIRGAGTTRCWATGCEDTTPLSRCF